MPAGLDGFLGRAGDSTPSPVAPEPSITAQSESTGSTSLDRDPAPIKNREAARLESASERQAPDAAKAGSRDRAAGKVPSASSAAMPKALDKGIAESRVESQPEKFKSAPIPAQGVTTAQEVSTFPGDLGGRGLGFSFESLRQPGVRPAPFPSEPIPDYELVVRRRPPQRADQATSAGSQDSLQKQAGGAAASKSAEGRRQAEAVSRGNSPLEILWFSVPFERYEQFKKELAAQSIVESEIPVAIKEKEASFIADRPLLIKITVLPSADR